MRAREIILENKLSWRIRSSQFKDLDALIAVRASVLGRFFNSIDK